MSRSRDISIILGTTEADNSQNNILLNTTSSTVLDSAQVTTIATDTGIAVYTTLDSLPSTGLSSGDQAFVSSNKRLYISNGSGWYNVSLINLSPQFDSDLNSTFTITDSATALVITNPASDSDNPDSIITYSGEASDSAQYLVNIINDSSVWTFTPLSADSVYNNVTLGNIPDSDGGDFTYTFKASDQINFASKLVTINYSGLAPVPLGDGLYLSSREYPMGQGSSGRLGFRYEASPSDLRIQSATGITNLFNTMKTFPGSFIDRLELKNGTEIKLTMYSGTSGTKNDGRYYTANVHNPGWVWDHSVGTIQILSKINSDLNDGISTNVYAATAFFQVNGDIGDYSAADLRYGTYNGANDWASNEDNRIVVTAIVGINGTRWDNDNPATWNGNMTFPPPNS
jgi:hypothetical protein